MDLAAILNGVVRAIGAFDSSELLFLDALGTWLLNSNLKLTRGIMKLFFIPLLPKIHSLCLNTHYKIAYNSNY